MPIIREWKCDACGHEFERITPECPRCYGAAHRVFLTPFGISKGVAKRTDARLEHQFTKLGISNFRTGQDGPNKITWKPKKFGSRASGGQQEITAVYGRNNFGDIGVNPLSMTKDGAPFALPNDATGAGLPPGIPIGGRPTELFKNTNIIGKIDSDGRSVRRVE